MLQGRLGCFRKTINPQVSDQAVAPIFAMNQTKKSSARSALSAVIAAALLLSIAACADDNPLQIAVIGPMSGKDRAGGQAMLDGVNLCVAEINKNGGIAGRKLEVLAYDDQNSKNMARQKSLEIARDSKVLAVIGHYYSSTSIEGGSNYRQYGIPAVTASATASEVTEANDWYFRVVPDTKLQGKFAAIYTSEILKHDRVAVVYERDAYGAALQRSFTRTARDLGLQIQDTWGVDAATEDEDNLFKKITLDLQGNPNPGALFVALQDHEAAKLVRHIRDAGVDLTIIGGDAIGSEAFPRIFTDTPFRKRGYGHYTDGIYATTFFIRDIGNLHAQQFSHAFKRRFGRQPDDLAATSYDAAAIVVEAIKRAKPGGDLAESRERIRSQLAAFSSIETAHKGVSGRIYFDEHGNAMKPFPFGLYLQGKLISAPVQLKPVVNPKAIADLEEKLKEGKIISVDDQLMHKTAVVHTGIDINEISKIDPRNETFSADIYLWFRHRSPLDYSKIEFLNAAKGIYLGDAIMKMSIDDMSYSAYRIKGDFQASFYFRDYPFDSQTLSIRFRHKTLNSSDLLFVADDIGMQRDGGIPMVERFRQHSILDPAGEWHLQHVMVFSDISATDSTLGNPRLFHSAADTGINYSRFNVVTGIERNAKNYILNNLIPLFIIILLGYAMLYVSPQGPPFVARMNLGVTALLTAIILSMRASGQLPGVGYLVALDYIYFAVYGLILSGIILSVAVLMATRRGKDILAKRLEMTGRVFQPLFFLTATAIFIFMYI